MHVHWAGMPMVQEITQNYGASACSVAKKIKSMHGRSTSTLHLTRQAWRQLCLGRAAVLDHGKVQRQLLARRRGAGRAGRQPHVRRVWVKRPLRCGPAVRPCGERAFSRPWLSPQRSGSFCSHWQRPGRHRPVRRLRVQRRVVRRPCMSNTHMTVTGKRCTACHARQRPAGCCDWRPVQHAWVRHCRPVLCVAAQSPFGQPPCHQHV